MIHVFKAVDQPMMLDVGSGAVHALDEIAYRALLWVQEHPGEPLGNAKAELLKSFSTEEVDEIMEELHQLKQMGAMEAPDGYSGLELNSPGVIKAMCLHAAHDCNLRCKYCFAATGDFCMGERKLLPLEVGKAALDWLVKMSGKRVNLEVDFFGGEPMMNFPVIKELVAYGRSLEPLHNKQFKFTTTTNCTLLNDEMIDFLNQEMDNVVISLDGRPEIHDRMRPTPNGKGSYDVIIERAKKFAQKRGHQRYYIRGTFTGYNKDFGEDVMFLADQGFEQISVEPVVTSPDMDYAIREEDLPAIKAEYERLAGQYYQRRKNGKWFNFFHFMIDLEGGPCLRKRLTGCGAGNEYVAITPDGDIFPCHQFVGREHYKMGNVMEGTFSSEIQQQFAHNHVLNKEKCRSCWARYFCSGGCAANAEAYHGDISKPYDMECQLEQKRLECAMALYAKEHLTEE